MNNVLITGGSGFLGSHLAEQLIDRGVTVTIIDNFADAPRSNLAAVEGRYRLILGDVRDVAPWQQVGAVDTVFHLAANANVPRSSQEPLYDASVNILGTVNALNLAHDRGARFFLASSGAVYGEPVSPPMSESHVLAPVSPYGASKLAAESYVTLYRQLYGLDGVIVRLFNMFGPRQRRFVVYDFARKILQDGEDVVMLGDGRQIRSQLFVYDAVRALLLVAERGTLPIYNVGSSASFSVSDLMDELLRLLGYSKPKRTSNASWAGDIQRLVPDVSLLHELGFREEYSLRDGLRLFLAWFTAEEALEPFAIKAR